MTAYTRRHFLKITAVAGGGLVLTISLPGCRPKSGAAPTAGGPIDPGVFVRINPDNTVVITITKSEMGQGIRTSLAMLVAEDLDADWNQVRVEQASFAPKYGEMGTGGSSSVLSNWKRLREAGAALKGMLVAAAAKDWGVDPKDCRAENSFVIHPASDRRTPYGALAAKAAALSLPNQVTLKPKAEWKLLGKDRSGVDVADITHGTAVYGLDVKIPGMLYAAIERTSVFGGKVKSVDSAKALAVPGVKQVVQIDAMGDGINIHAGVAVVATNTWAALQGRKQLAITWDEGPRAAESSESYRAFMTAAVNRAGEETVNKQGDPDAVLAKATKVIASTFETPFLSHATMEPMNCTASVTGNQVEVWSPTQFPDWGAQSLAKALNTDIKNVQVHVTLMGGGFGRRINPDFTVEAALLSQKIKQPVKVVWTREDDLRHDFYRPCSTHRIEASLGADGRPEAWRHRVSTPSIDVLYGPKPPNGWGPNETDGSANMSYRVPNRSCEYTLLDSGVPRGWWRAVSTTHGMFAVESMIDELAEAAGKDPYEYRLGLIDKVWWQQPPDSKEFPFSPDRLKGVLTLAADSGPVLNPIGARAQLEGGIIQGLSATIKERITIVGGAVKERNFDGYSVLRINEAPAVIEVYFVETDTHPTGFGEPAVPPVAAGLANAIYRATGKRVRTLPLGLRMA